MHLCLIQQGPNLQKAFKSFLMNTLYCELLNNILFDNYFDFFLILKEYTYENISYSNKKQKFHFIVLSPILD